MFKVTIRELLVWITLAAVSITWWIDSRRGAKAIKENAALRKKLESVESALAVANAELDRQPWLRRQPPGPRRSQ
jgi:hypothetical protein